MASYKFHFRPVLSLFTVIAFSSFVALGIWQLGRLEWKQTLIAQVELRINAAPIPFDEAARRAEQGEDMEYTPVTLTGNFDHEAAAVVFGSYEGAPGGYYFTPVSDGAQNFVYVNQGFAPQDVLKSGILAPPPAEAVSQINGLFRSREIPAPPASWFQIKGKSVDGLWFIRDPFAFAADLGRSASPHYIDQFAVEGREWPKGGTTRLEFSNRHLDYALTWFALSVTLIGVWLAFSLQKRP